MSINIFNPRWHDRTVLIAKYKVTDGMNEIVFTKSTLKGKSYKVLGSVIKKCPVENNGVIACYAVPLDVVMGEKELI